MALQAVAVGGLGAMAAAPGVGEGTGRVAAPHVLARLLLSDERAPGTSLISS